MTDCGIPAPSELSQRAPRLRRMLRQFVALLTITAAAAFVALGGHAEPQESSDVFGSSDVFLPAGACEESKLDPGVIEIWIHREGGCLGYYLPEGVSPGRPVNLTGPCAGYTLILRSDGSAEYRGHEHVPLIGRYVGRVNAEPFRRLARLANEIGVDQWPSDVLPKSKSGWVCVTMDGELPVTVSVRWLNHQQRVRFDPDRQNPVWLTIFVEEIDKLGQAIDWKAAAAP